MSDARPDAPEPQPRVRLTFASGGWVLLLSALMSLALVAFWVVPALVGRGERMSRGDGEDPSTYGFDLATLRVPRAPLKASGLAKDGLPALIDPRTLTLAEADDLPRRERGKFLVPDDLVIGVALGGEARAYPVRLLNWHEVVNDTLGGTPIVVAYSGLADVAVVYERRLGGKVVVFGVAGLLYNSMPLMYDRRPLARGESLWLPLSRRAIAGPEAGAGTELVPLPLQVATWAEWRKRHPETTVLWPDPQWRKRYKDEAYSAYYGNDSLRFPVAPLPEELSIPLKTPVVALEHGGVRRVLSLPFLLRQCEASGGIYRTEVGGRAVSITARGPRPLEAWVEAADGGPTPLVARSFWFAWHATFPQDRVEHAPGPGLNP